MTLLILTSRLIGFISGYSPKQTSSQKSRMPTTWGSCSSGRMTSMLCPCPSKRRLVHDELCPFSGLHPANHNSFKTNEEKEEKTSWLQQSMTSHHIQQTGVLKSRRETAAQTHHKRLVSHLQNCPGNYLERDQSPHFIIQLPTVCEVLIPVYIYICA